MPKQNVTISVSVNSLTYSHLDKIAAAANKKSTPSDVAAVILRWGFSNLDTLIKPTGTLKRA